MPDKMIKADNKPAKHPGGRPLKYKTVQELQVLIDDYFERCDRDKIKYTVSGLAYDIGMSRQMLCEYQMKNEFGDAIKNAKAKIEAALESYILNSNNPAGAIFVAKNNYGWADKREIDTNMTGKLTICWDDDDDNTIDITPK